MHSGLVEGGRSQGAYMQATLERAPHYQSIVLTLLKQHNELTEKREELRLLLRSGVELSSWWLCVESDFKQFAAELLRHYHTDTEVLQMTYTEDIGTKD